MADTSDTFQSLSLEDDNETVSESGPAKSVGETSSQDAEVEGGEHRNEDSTEHATLDVSDSRGLSHGEDSGEHVASVEKSMERTVDMPPSSALVSLSPVDERDLIVTIGDPMVINPPSSYSGPYATYAVDTKTTRKTFDHSNYSVRRRYQDFVWMREQLVETYQTHIVPPLPDKHTLSRLVANDHFTSEFLQRRQDALQKFLNRLTDHPTISFDRTLLTFLTATDQALQTAKSKSSGLLNKVTATVRQAATGILLKNPEKEFVALQSYFSSLQKHLAAIESSASSLLVDGQELKTELAAVSTLCERWASIEKEDGPMFQSLSECFKTVSESTGAMCTDLAPAFAPFHEYSLYCASAQDVLKRREALQMDHELAVEDLVLKQGAVEEANLADMSKSFMSLFSKPEKLKADRIQAAEANFAGAQKASELTSDDMECANEHLRADMSRWQRVKKSDIADTFVDVADVHIAHLQKSLEAWQGVMAVLNTSAASSSATGVSNVA